MLSIKYTLTYYSDITRRSAVFINQKITIYDTVFILYSHQPSVSCIVIRHMNTIKIYKHYNELRKEIL